MADGIEEIEVLESNTHDESHPKVLPKIVTNKRHKSWVEGIEDSDKEAQKMEQQTNPIATAKSNFHWQQQHQHRKSSEDDCSVQLSDEIESPATSSVDSSNKRTFSTAAVDPQAMRRRIRQKLKQHIENKRGTVHLSKRLQRHQQLKLEKSTTADSDKMDEELLEKQIEDSIKLSEKCTNGRAKHLPSDDIQYEFMTRNYLKDHETETNKKRNCKAIFMAAKPKSVEEEEQFAALCITYDERLPTTSTESGMANTTAKLRNQAVLIRRIGTHFVDGSGTILGTNQDIDKTPKRPEHYDDEFRPLYRYVKAEDFKKALTRNRQQSFVQLDIDLNRIIFSYHWLFGEEDVLCSTIQNLHKAQSVRAQEALEMLREIDFLERKLREAEIFRQNEKENMQHRIMELLMELEKKQQSYLHLSDQIEENWTRLQQLREHRGYSTTTLTVKKTSFKQQQIENRKESDKSKAVVPDNLDILDEIRDIPVYLLSYADNGDKCSESNNQIPKVECDRINLLQKCRLQLQIEFNDIVVCRTLYRPIDSRFQVQFGQIYNLQIQEIPQSVKITVFEKAPKTEARKIAVVGLPLPDEDSITDGHGGKLGSVEFASDLVISGMHSSLGCGDDRPCLSGELYCCVTWAKQGVFQSEKRQQRSFFTSQQQPQSYRRKEFDLIPKAVRLCSDEEFENNIRLQVIENRYEQKTGIKQPIPLLCSEIEQQLSEPPRPPSQYNYKTGIDKHRMDGNRNAVMIRNCRREQMIREEKMKTAQNLIEEEPIPTFFGAFSSLLFAPIKRSRKLKPTRKTAIRRQALSDLEYNLVVNIQSAINLPEPEQGILQPFVEVSFQGSSVQTIAVGGKNANWQQTVELKLNRRESNNDFSMITDSVQIAIYDRRVSKLDADDREPNTVHEQLERRWLGSVFVPFTTIYCSGKIDGRLRIQTPLFLDSYKINEQPAYLKLLIALEPNISAPLIASTTFPTSDESQDIHRRSVEWERNVSSRFPNRRYISLVQEASGKRLLACRFIRPIKPPLNLLKDAAESLQQVARTACRLVSYIPFVSDPVAFPDFSDVWTTSDQFLSMGCGDEEEHAILLCCWLLYTGIRAYILFGVSLPEGPRSAFVLALAPEGTIILNPSDGNFYNVTDPLCPIRSIGTVACVGNLYANIQNHEHPSQMQFDFRKRSHWLPLFENDQADMKSVQPEQIAYFETENDAVLQLRTNLEREIRLKFDHCRQYGIPQWNLLASRILREILAELESKDDQGQVNVNLTQLRSSYHVNAVAFRQRYDTSDGIVERVLALRMHENTDRSIQFAFAVHLQPFINNILSCSVAVAALKPLIN